MLYKNCTGSAVCISLFYGRRTSGLLCCDTCCNAFGDTDFLDGQIARRCNMITDLGKIIDPAADKLMQLAMLVTLAINIPYMCILAVYLIVKEVVMALMGLVVMKRANRRLDGAKWYGKVCTAVLYVCMLALVAFPHMPVNLQYVIMIVCAAVLTFAFIMYIRIYIIMLKDNHYGNDERKLYLYV